MTIALVVNLALTSLIDMIYINRVRAIFYPLLLMYGWTAALLFYLYGCLLHFTCRICFRGADINAYPHYIHCIWHQNLGLYFAVFIKCMGNQVWMSHPAWHLQHIIFLLRLMKVKKICLGSAGHHGMKALSHITGYIEQGYSTVIAADGPYGPRYKLKKGVVLMACRSHVPVIALRFTCSHFFHTPEWDRKIFPLPFSTITVHVGEPIFVSKPNLETAPGRIADWLNGTMAQ